MIDRLREVLIAVCIALGLDGCVAVAHAADRGYVARAEEITIVFSAEKCTDKKILARVKPEYQAKFNAGAVVVPGERLAICWLEKDDVLHFIGAAGEPGAIPVDDPHVTPTNKL